MGSSNRSRGRASAALTALILSLVISVQQKDHGNDQVLVNDELTAAVVAAAGIPNVLRRIFGLITFVKALDPYSKPDSNPRPPH